MRLHTMERFLWPRTKRSGKLITFTFLLESHAEQQAPKYEPLFTAKQAQTKEYKAAGARKGAGKYNVQVL